MSRNDRNHHDGASPADDAMEWIVHLHSGRAGAGDRLRYMAWRRADPAREAAAREAEALWRELGCVRRPAGLTRPPRRPGRREALGFGLAAGVALLVAGAGFPRFVSGLYADHATGVGERREIALPDGSMLTLDAASAVSVDYTGAARRLTLHDGRAMFGVVPDSARPFVVIAGRGETRALGTVFQVERRGEGGIVTVTEGRVEIRAAAAGAGAKAVLRAGHAARYDGGGHVARPRRVDAGAATAWRRGKMIFDRRPLGEVVAEVNRYHPGRIVILSDRLAGMELTGVFETGDKRNLLRAIEATLPVTITRLPLITIIR